MRFRQIKEREGSAFLVGSTVASETGEESNRTASNCHGTLHFSRQSSTRNTRLPRKEGISMGNQPARNNILDKAKQYFTFLRARTAELNTPCHSYSRFWLLYFWCLTLLRKCIMRALSGEEKDLLFGGEGGKSVEKDTLEDLLLRVEYAYCSYPRRPLTKILKRNGFDLLRHEKVASPGKVAHYIAINHTDKVLMVAARGSAEISDFLTNMAGKTIEYGFQEADDPRFRSFGVHEGYLSAAEALFSSTSDFLSNDLLQKGYNIQLVGHSLGASVAVLLGLLLRHQFSLLKEAGRLRVWAFATVPCLTAEAARACEPFVTSMVWNHDTVPCLSAANYDATWNLLLIIESRFRRITGLKNLLRGALSAVGTRVGVIEIPKQELYDFKVEFINYVKELTMERHQSDQMHLYIPGKVIYLWERQHYGVYTGEVAGVAKTSGATLPILSMVFVDISSLFDHKLVSHRKALQRSIAQMVDRD